MQGQQPASNPNSKGSPGLTNSHFAYKLNTATTKTTATPQTTHAIRCSIWSENILILLETHKWVFAHDKYAWRKQNAFFFSTLFPRVLLLKAQPKQTFSSQFSEVNGSYMQIKLSLYF